ncbi:serine/threonine-protein kinase HipA [Pedobacter cryoconitis]|uniref:Serine/threonine-protein kinase HipA n=1 Tax=Pedobacter cryoconitis TaxID=188932 RepID=A0A7W8YYC6_9SPHI|nr:HipA N-terminal domain-containing protein [Pedobacter cryoconitis]MBB5624061.1 serine/threonine-protein kinase HipA [Pedobacter cryoconitis]MBB5647295.1 serine/threonine-protein kinase HipA [Pedobacter cryoconitis]
MQKAKVYYREFLAGILEQYDGGYRFTYDPIYLDMEKSMPVSLTLPLSPYPYLSRILFPFFDGLIPEGWLLHIAREQWNFKRNDRFELLINLCRDTIGAVTVYPEEEEENG